MTEDSQTAQTQAKNDTNSSPQPQIPIARASRPPMPRTPSKPFTHRSNENHPSSNEAEARPNQAEGLGNRSTNSTNNNNRRNNNFRGGRGGRGRMVSSEPKTKSINSDRVQYMVRRSQDNQEGLPAALEKLQSVKNIRGTGKPTTI